MPMPIWWGHIINKRLFNPVALRGGNWPVLRHVGRSSGNTYRTPIGAMKTEGDAYLFLVVYGPKTDWLQNVLTAGDAVLEIDGGEVALTAPRLVAIDDAFSRLAPDTKRPPRFARVEQCLEMDVA